MINYDGRVFASIANADNGDVSTDTIFEYHQEGSTVWAIYRGGKVRFGTLIAHCDAEGSLDMRYQHLDARGVFRTGECRSTPELLSDGRVRLHEQWRWTNGDGSSGASILEERR